MSKDERGPLSRRALAKGAVLGGAFFAMGAGEGADEGKGAQMSETVFDVRAFGAKGDGQTDDTAAIQKALDAAGDKKAAAFVPPGTYMCAELKMHRNSAFIGIPAWGYGRSPGGSVLKLANDKAKFLLDMAGAVGSTLEGLSLDGGKLGTDIVGISIVKPDYKEEDALRIERCQVARFSGDGVRMEKIWCFTMRHSMIAHNKGNGVNCEGWDGFLLDNWLSGNDGFGYGPGDVCSVTVTGNRVEWNKEGGLVLLEGSHYNVTGNYIDRSGKAGIVIMPRKEGNNCGQMTVTGNLIYRSGKHAEPESYDSSQVRLEGSYGVTFVGNTMVAGQDDAAKGNWSPTYGMVLRGLNDCIVKDNVLHNGALKEIILDLGGHKEGVIIKDNVGCVKKIA
jgi:hypothetical protein